MAHQGLSGRWLLALPALGLLVLSGCADGRIERALLADRNPAAHGHDLAALYTVHCPDVLELRIANKPHWSGQQTVGPDGRIVLGEAGPLRVDGLSAPEIARRVAEKARLPWERVDVVVVGYNSQQLYLYGAIPGEEHAVPYRGPETVLDLLQRAGGLTPGSAPADVQIVRAHVADGKPPEVFHVDLRAILFKHDQQSNVRLQPFDQIHIGRNRRSCLESCFPPWLHPTYERLCGLRRRP
jgi:protein involved in polysaccharide export with SLBB domain